jgi:hypothetical protein
MRHGVAPAQVRLSITTGKCCRSGGIPAHPARYFHFPNHLHNIDPAPFVLFLNQESRCQTN